MIFAALALYWFGRDLVRVWGPLRFLGAYLSLAAAAAGVTCLVALAFPALRAYAFLGAWPVVSALIIAWACLFPSRNLLLYFVDAAGRPQPDLRDPRRHAAVRACSSRDMARYIPHFAAQLLSLAAMRGNPLRPLWTRLRFELAYGRWRRRTSRLREVPRPRDEGPRYYH